MAMRTAAKSISRRLFSGARNFSEKSLCSDWAKELKLQPNYCSICRQPIEELIGIKAESHDIHKVIKQLTEKVDELSDELNYLYDDYSPVIEEAKANRTYMDVTTTQRCILCCASAMGGYYLGTIVRDKI